MLVPAFLALLLGQAQDLTLSIGAHSSSGYGNGQFFGVNYGHRWMDGAGWRLNGQIDFMASPNIPARFVDPLATRDVASLFLMPGLRLSFLPSRRCSPFVQAGAGLASYEQSRLLQNGEPFPGGRLSHHFGALYGGGADFRLYRFIGLRLEAKDHYSQRHNPAAGIGLHFRWGGN